MNDNNANIILNHEKGSAQLIQNGIPTCSYEKPLGNRGTISLSIYILQQFEIRCIT